MYDQDLRAPELEVKVDEHLSRQEAYASRFEGGAFFNGGNHATLADFYLVEAICEGNFGLADAVLQEARTNIFGQEFLQIAIENQRYEMLDFLLNKGVTAGNGRWFPFYLCEGDVVDILDFAVMHDDTRAFDAIISAKAYNNGNDPFSMSAYRIENDLDEGRQQKWQGRLHLLRSLTQSPSHVPVP